MPQKSIYLSDDDQAAWDTLAELAERRGTSMSKLIAGFVRQTARDSAKATGVPLGVKVPASMKDPVEVEREQLAEDIKVIVLERLMKMPASS